MRNDVLELTQRSRLHTPAERSYLILYRDNQVNNCPGCGRTHWFVGRRTASCAFCDFTLDIQQAY
jgi:hypothetical protein